MVAICGWWCFFLTWITVKVKCFPPLISCNLTRKLHIGFILENRAHLLFFHFSIFLCGDQFCAVGVVWCSTLRSLLLPVCCQLISQDELDLHFVLRTLQPRWCSTPLDRSGKTFWVCEFHNNTARRRLCFCFLLKKASNQNIHQEMFLVFNVQDWSHPDFLRDIWIKRLKVGRRLNSHNSLYSMLHGLTVSARWAWVCLP